MVDPSNIPRKLRFITIGNWDVGKTAIVQKFLFPQMQLGDKIETVVDV